MYLKAIEFSSKEQKLELQHLFSIAPKDSTDKIDMVKQIYVSSGATQATQNEIKNYTDKAFIYLEKLSVDSDKKTILKQFGDALMNRKM